jgi:hypothetical protein
VPGIGVQPAVRLGYPPGQLAEQHRQQHRAGRDHGQHGQRAGARRSQHARHREYPDPDDAPDYQWRRRGQAERRRLFLARGLGWLDHLPDVSVAGHQTSWK